MHPPPGFLFVTCQHGAEASLKREVAQFWPSFRFAYSRPGFLTFKLPPDHGLAEDFDLRCVLARSYGLSLGKATGKSSSELAAAVWTLAVDLPCDRLHVWPRDRFPAGQRGYQIAIGPESAEAVEAIRRAAPEGQAFSARAASATLPARVGQRVLDVAIVEEDLWWVGYHRAKSWPSRFPGGLWPLELPEDAVSRAYLKMEEALRWSELPLKSGQRCVEIGSAPGGSAQALLDRGLLVTGVDPAEMDSAVADHPNFTHLRKRGSEVRCREFRKTKWLFADLNVVPAMTLETVERIATHPEVDLKGMILTLKLGDWEQMSEAPVWLDRVRAWGFGHVVARQLQHNRMEICVAAMRRAPADADRARRDWRRRDAAVHRPVLVAPELARPEEE